MTASDTRLRFCELHIRYAAQVLVTDTYTTISTKDSAYLQALKVIFSQFLRYNTKIYTSLTPPVHAKNARFRAVKKDPGCSNQPPIFSPQILVLTVALSSSPMIPPPLTLHFSLTRRSVTEFLSTPDMA